VEDVPYITSGQSSYALGSYNDATFGTLTTNLITQIYDYNAYDSVKEIYEIDSVVLFLVYGNAYPFHEGQALDPMTISIGELINPITIDSATEDYRSDTNLPHYSGSVLSNYLLDEDELNIRDSVMDPSDSSAKVLQPIFRLRLDKNNSSGEAYARKLLTASKDAKDANDFLEKVPGLYFEAHPEMMTNKGNIVNFNFYSDYGSPGIRVYYKKTASDTVSSEKSYSFNFAGGTTYNYINIDRTTGTSALAQDLQNQLAGDTALGQKTLFLQSFYGSMMRLRMPDIREFANIPAANGKKIVINQDVLIMNAEPNAKFSPATALNIAYAPTSDSLYSLADQSFNIGGLYDENKSEYRFYLTRHIQNLLQNPNAENVPLTIYSNTRNIIPDITTILGPDRANGDKRMRLEVVYSVLP
jgi:hypothetical protein